MREVYFAEKKKNINFEKNIMEANSPYLPFLALAGEYCSIVQNAREEDRREFVEKAVILLPELYVAMLKAPAPEVADYEVAFLPQYVDEDYYDSVRRSLEMLFGPDDTYLETQLEDMKYSDVPIGASISEGMADIFQDLFNFLSAVRESDGESMNTAFGACRENFESYWAQILVNVMRPLNTLRLQTTDA